MTTAGTILQLFVTYNIGLIAVTLSLAMTIFAVALLKNLLRKV
jgi:hypothetical protein